MNSGVGVAVALLVGVATAALAVSCRQRVELVALRRTLAAERRAAVSTAQQSPAGSGDPSPAPPPQRATPVLARAEPRAQPGRSPSPAPSTAGSEAADAAVSAPFKRLPAALAPAAAQRVVPLPCSSLVAAPPPPAGLLLAPCSHQRQPLAVRPCSAPLDGDEARGESCEFDYAHEVEYGASGVRAGGFPSQQQRAEGGTRDAPTDCGGGIAAMPAAAAAHSPLRGAAGGELLTDAAPALLQSGAQAPQRTLALPDAGGSSGSGSGSSDGAAAEGALSLHAPAKPRLPQLGLNVLVVDDEPVNRKLVGRMLSRMGCSWVEASDGDEVGDALVSSERPIDLIILDVIMVRTSGLEVCASLRSQHVTLPILAATGHYHPDEAAVYAAAGFTGVLTKPFAAVELAAALAYCTSVVGMGSSAPA